MNARIIVTLMIVLSMCMVCTASLGEDKRQWRLEGIDDGYDDGERDGYNGNSYSYSNMNYPGDCPPNCESSYRVGYKTGYRSGYSNGEDQAELDLLPDPSNGSGNSENATDPKTNKTTTGDKKDPVNSMSSPSMGIGFMLPDGTITQKGDQLPTLYTWAEAGNKYEHHTTLDFPANGTYTGCVIITPPQIAGEPLVPNNFWNTPKGQRILEWKANAGAT